MTDINNSVNQILMEITKEELIDHLHRHGKHYLAGLGLLAAGVGAHKGYKAYQNHKRNKSVLGHLNRHREGYGGAALGALTAAASSGGQPISHRILKTLGGGLAGGAAGMTLGNIRHSEEFANKLKSK